MFIVKLNHALYKYQSAIRRETVSLKKAFGILRLMVSHYI